MIDFTASLYLGLHHSSRSLLPWTQFSLGVPAALRTPPLAATVERGLARLQGCERAVLAPSTLHLAWDFFDLLSRQRTALYVDADVYPILRWGAERAAARGTPVQPFPHHDADALARLLRRSAHRRRPVVVTDGWCPRCGEAAPVAAYLEAVQPYGGRLILDDTQALGVLGKRPTAKQPYGREGGGLLRWADVPGTDVVVMASLAKGFGVPVAVLAGREADVQRFERESRTRVHCSPPSVAVLHAAMHALALNQTQGDVRRRKLLCLVRHFRATLAEVGITARGRLFPVQTLALPPAVDVRRVHQRLLQGGVRTVLLRGSPGRPPEIGFVLTAEHTLADVEAATTTLARVVAHSGLPPGSNPTWRTSYADDQNSRWV